MDSIYSVNFVFWPLVIVCCALINMLVSRTFSICELIFSYIVACAAATFWRIIGLGDVQLYSLNGFELLAIILIVATLWASVLDRFAIYYASSRTKSLILSLLIGPSKLPFSPLTTTIGFCFWLKGLTVIKTGGKVGFTGGILWSEYAPSKRGHAALTLGASVVCFRGWTPLKHELYHTRQYIYFSDLFIPFWLLGCLWGCLSAWFSPSHRICMDLAMGADSSAEVGNPLEISAHHLWSFCRS